MKRIKTILRKIWNFVVFAYLYIQGKTPKQLWSKELAQLLSSVDEKDLPLYEVLLKNQYVTDNLRVGVYNNQIGLDSTKFRRITKQTIDGLLALRDIVSVQPMNGPVSLVFHLECKKLEGQEDGTKLSLNVVSSAIEAASLKCQSRLPVEVPNINGMDIGKEIEQAIASENAEEFSADVLSNVRRLSKKLNVDTRDNLDILHTISKECNEIAQQTRRGQGNFVVVDPDTLLRISEAASRNSSPKDMFVQADSDNLGSTLLGLRFAGVLNKTIKVFYSPFQDYGTILVGYKGSNECDAGFIYAPYVLTLPVGVVVDPKTVEPIIPLMVRQGKFVAENAADYYTTITLKHL